MPHAEVEIHRACGVARAGLLAARDGAIPLSHEPGTCGQGAPGHGMPVLSSLQLLAWWGVALVWLPIRFSVLRCKWKEIGIVGCGTITKEG